VFLFNKNIQPNRDSFMICSVWLPPGSTDLILSSQFMNTPFQLFKGALISMLMKSHNYKNGLRN
jgi:hypothetical protein